jgi:hypothetical protein
MEQIKTLKQGQQRSNMVQQVTNSKNSCFTAVQCSKQKTTRMTTTMIQRQENGKPTQTTFERLTTAFLEFLKWKY